MLQLRNDVPIPHQLLTSNDICRRLSLFTLALFALRFYKLTLPKGDYCRPLELAAVHSHPLEHAANLVLHVLGGCGAVWGCSEAVGVRDETNRELWRVLARLVGVLFLLRWLVQLISCLLPRWTSRRYQSSLLKPCLDWMEVVAVKFVLEVMGAAGAIWGCSQIVLLRTDETTHFWRVVAMITLIWFMIRWLRILVSFATNKHGRENGIRHCLEKQDSEIHDLVLTETHTLNSKETISVAATSCPPPYQSTP